MKKILLVGILTLGMSFAVGSGYSEPTVVSPTGAEQFVGSSQAP